MPQKTYDTTIARMVGNLIGNALDGKDIIRAAEQGVSVVDPIVRGAVAYARAIVAEVERTARLTAPHDSECESELTSHGYSPCRCHERAGICYCRKNPCVCLPDPVEAIRAHVKVAYDKALRASNLGAGATSAENCANTGIRLATDIEGQLYKVLNLLSANELLMKLPAEVERTEPKAE